VSDYIDELIPVLRPRPVLVVITGAGASHDSVAHAREGYSPDRPPLSQGLFHPDFLRRFLANDLASAMSLIASLAIDPKGADLELLLDREFEASDGNPSLRRSFTALRFYLRDAIAHCQVEWPKQVGGATNYAWLVREVEHWRSRVDGYVAWVTFNYDTLLEDALLGLFQRSGLGGGRDRRP
jgi:hypothetical protein